MTPTLTMLCGLPGSGKTVRARELEAAGGGVLLNADARVCQLYPDDAEAAARDERKFIVHDVQWELTERLLADGSASSSTGVSGVETSGITIANVLGNSEPRCTRSSWMHPLRRSMNGSPAETSISRREPSTSRPRNSTNGPRASNHQPTRKQRGADAQLSVNRGDTGSLTGLADVGGSVERHPCVLAQQLG